jgi:hypothetical protein
MIKGKLPGFILGNTNIVPIISCLKNGFHSTIDGELLLNKYNNLPNLLPQFLLMGKGLSRNN